jgi:hypothetical protein
MLRMASELIRMCCCAAQPTLLQNKAMRGKGDHMTIERIVLAFAGALILLSLLLTYFISPYWLLLSAFVGLNLFQAAFTGLCPLSYILKKMGVQTGAAFG